MKAGNNIVSVCVACICLLARVGVVQAITTSVVLQQEPEVHVGQTAKYTCAASGRITSATDRDPTFTWSIRDTDTAGTLITDLSSIATTPGVDDDATDGAAKSQVEFTMESRYLTKRIWCGAIDYLQSSPSVQIFGVIYESSPRVLLGDTCSSTVGCSTNFASCQSGTCQCNNNYYDSNGATLGGDCNQQSTIGNNCVPNVANSCRGNFVTCTTSGISSTCSCQSGYIQSGVSCIIDNAAGLGESCQSKSCAVPNSYCNSNVVCQCNTNYYQSGSSTCSLKSVIGNTCDPAFADSCSTTRSSCDSSTRTCKCNTGYSYNAASNGCVEPTLGQSCSSVVGCLAPSSVTSTAPQCVNNVCVCPSNTYVNSGECKDKASLGQTCSATSFQSCSDANAQCTGSGPTCQCATGYIQSGSVCVVQNTGQQYCATNTQVSVTTFGVDNTISSPSISTPDLRVDRTCYEVDLQGTITMPCTDVKSNHLPYQSGGWFRMPGNTAVPTSTQGYINGAIDQPDLTISNARVDNDGLYVCTMCYGAGFTRCTTSAQIEVQVNGTDISSVSASVSPSTPKVGDTVTFTCGTVPSNVASSYEWYRGSTRIGTTATLTVNNIATSDDGVYYCVARNNFRTLQSNNQITVAVQYAPTFSLPGGGTTTYYTADLDAASVEIECSMTGNPAVNTYYFYNEQGTLIQTGTTNKHTVTSTSGYGRYSCKASNAVGLSSGILYLEVGLDQGPSTGASTADSGLSVGVIAAIVLGIIFLLLLIIIIIICCCNYGWCRKKEKVEPQPIIIEQPKVKPYIPRSVVSAGSTISRKDVGITLNGHTDSVSTEYEETYTTPRYFLKAATTSGPIISMYDDQSQPRAYQLPSLDTQALYSDEQPRRKHKKRKHRKHRQHRDESPRKYAPPPPEDEDLVVIPGPNAKQNYFE